MYLVCLLATVIAESGDCMPADEGHAAPGNASINSRDLLPQTGTGLYCPTPAVTQIHLRGSSKSETTRLQETTSTITQSFLKTDLSSSGHSVEANSATEPARSLPSRNYEKEALEDGSNVVTDDQFSTSPVIRFTDLNTNDPRWPLLRSPANNRKRSYSAASAVAWLADALFPRLNSPLDMIFSDKKSGEAARRRALSTTTEADLTSKDRTKQKEAIKKLLAGKVHEDWEFNWPSHEGDPEPAVVDENNEGSSDLEYVERDEWLSDFSDTEEDSPNSLKKAATNDSSTSHHTFSSPHKHLFHHDSPSRKLERRKNKRQRQFRDESEWNDGLRCYSARRDLWTGARYVRRAPKSKPKPHSSSPAAPSSSEETLEDVEIDTEIPLAPPILPPETLMRRGLNEKAYPMIYDKVVVQSQIPYCPVNLSVIVKSCVEGWKRDGEWPPKNAEVEAAISRKSKATTRRSSAPAGAREDDRDGASTKSRDRNSGIRRSWQKVLGIVHSGAKTREAVVDAAAMNHE